MGNYNAKDLLGKIFGELTVIEFEGTGKFRRHLWKCKCSCGNFTTVNSSALTSGNTKSCGCLVKTTNSLPFGRASLNKLLYTYKKNAAKRGLDFSLGLSDFERITSSECFYCGALPSLIVDNGNNKFNGDYVYNGIDRINNDVGYTLSNSVPCCDTCNYAKRAMSYTKFRDWVNKIHSHLISNHSD